MQISMFSCAVLYTSPLPKRCVSTPYCRAICPSNNKITAVNPCGYRSCFTLPTMSPPLRFAVSRAKFHNWAMVHCGSMATSKLSAIICSVLVPFPIRWLCIAPSVGVVPLFPMQFIILALQQFCYRRFAGFGVYSRYPVRLLQYF